MIIKIKALIIHILSKIRKKILGKHAIGIIYDTQNGILSAPVEDFVVGRSLGFKGSWDVSLIKKIIQKIDKTDNVFIIGTHVGTLLVPFAKKEYKIVGYEANPETFRYLNWNVKLNKLSNVTLFNFAVGDSKKKLSFYQNKTNSGGSKIKPIRDNYLYTYDNPNEIIVEMVDLDTHIESESLPNPDCVIMDIEGSEYFALKGMQKSLLHTKLLYIEYVPHHLKNVSNVSNQDFLGLIVPFFETVTFTSNNKRFNLVNERTELNKYLEGLRGKNYSDDLLFLK